MTRDFFFVDGSTTRSTDVGEDPIRTLRAMFPFRTLDIGFEECTGSVLEQRSDVSVDKQVSTSVCQLAVGKQVSMECVQLPTPQYRQV